MSCRTPWSYCACIPRRHLDSHWLLAAPASPSAKASAAALQRRFIHNDGPKTLNPLVNPPTASRPPPLTLPRRSVTPSTPKYYFELGKGYLRFYKDGLKNVWECRRLLKEKLQRTPADDQPSIFRPHYVPKSFSRGDWVLLWRVRHDMLRLPLFGVLLIVAGELTALVVALWMARCHIHAEFRSKSSQPTKRPSKEERQLLMTSRRRTPTGSLVHASTRVWHVPMCSEVYIFPGQYGTESVLHHQARG